jgi:hypothetical protein
VALGDDLPAAPLLAVVPERDIAFAGKQAKRGAAVDPSLTHDTSIL